MILCLLSTPVMAGEYDMECKRIEAKLKGYSDPYMFFCENEQATCYLVDQSDGGGISCFKK